MNGELCTVTPPKKEMRGGNKSEAGLERDMKVKLTRDWALRPRLFQHVMSVHGCADALSLFLSL